MKVFDGCSACANIAYKLSDISFIYPITPSSPMASQMDNLYSKGEKNIFNDGVKVIEMQSEAGAAGALHGALNAGNLASTFTASQGLLLMIPNMYKIAGEKLPAVIHVAARSIATHALSIFGDHQDVYACRQTGFCMISSTNVQDAHNLALISHLSAIESSLPFMHFFDGFRTSHEYNMLNQISTETIDKLVNREKINNFRARALNTNKAITKGTNQNEDIYFQSVEARNSDYLMVPDIVNNYMQKLNNEIGTDYKPFNYYGSSNAKYAIVAMGSVCDTIKHVINNNPLFGLVEVHLYRPFSTKYLLDVIPKTIKRIAVLDRTKESGSVGEPLYLDVLSALKETGIEVYGGRYGLSSKNTGPNDIYDVYMNLINEPKNNFTVGIIDDITNTSLKHYEYKEENKYTEFKIWGYGSDGMVSASKNLLKILSEKNYIQGYFEYDSKKSGGVTVSHLRVADKLIKAPYYVTNPKLIVISKDEYFYKFDLLNGLQAGSILLVNTNKNEDEFNKFLPESVKLKLRNLNAKIYIINAENLAIKNNIKGKISIILEAAILKLLNVSNYEELLINDVKERFKTKGEDIVNSNIKAIKDFNNYIEEIKIDDNKGIILKEPSTLFEKMNAREGNLLKVSDLKEYSDGTYPGDKSKEEKRKLSTYVPKWDKNKCIECGICSLVCPHGVIRPFLLNKDEMVNESKVSIDKEHNFIISCSEADCTSCGLCINNCPSKCLEFGVIEESKQKIADNLFDNHKNPVNDMKTIKDTQLKQPLFAFSGACAGCGETPYIKLLTQIVGEKLVIANATGCSSIYGASCPNTPYNLSWSNSLFEDAAEYGFGILNSYENLKHRIFKYLESNNNPKAKALLDLLINDGNNYEIIKSRLDDFKEFLPEDLISYVTPKSVWTIGGDGWAYDIGFGGLDHILSSNMNLKILVLDTEVYSNTGGQTSKSSRYGQIAEFADLGKKTNKKDLFKIAMTYPNVYVASISLGANMMHTIKVLKEAEEHNGPALIIAYSPCIEHGISGGMVNSINEEKLAVESGYILLMRYFDNNLYLDSKEPNFDKYEEFLLNEVRYSALKIKNKEKASELLNINKTNAMKRYNYFKELSNK